MIPTLSLQVVDEVADSNVESIGDDLQSSQRHALFPGFEPVEMRAVQPRPLR